MPAAVGVVAALMGFNLLGVLPFTFPSLDVDVRQLPVPPVAVAYAAGLTFALAASPCSTPILASLLAFAATQDAPAAGATLLFTYSLGYIAPLLVAATATVRPPTPHSTPSADVIHTSPHSVPNARHHLISMVSHPHGSLGTSPESTGRRPPHVAARPTHLPLMRCPTMFCAAALPCRMRTPSLRAAVPRPAMAANPGTSFDWWWRWCRRR